MEKKTWNTETAEAETEKKIKNEEFRALNPKEIPSKIYEIFEKIQQKKLEGVDLKDKFFIKDYISIVNNLSVASGGPRELDFNFETQGLVEELKDKYESALKAQIEKLNLEPDQLYAIYNWDHEFNMFDKKEEIINDETPFKGSYDGKLIINGEANQ